MKGPVTPAYVELQDGQPGPPSWQERWAARWRWLFRRWAFALGGLGVGSAGGWLLSLDSLHAHGRSLQALQDLQHQMAAQPQPRALNTSVEPEALARLPVIGRQTATWLALQQVLALHRVSVLSLRPLDDRRAASLPNQAVALRMQGRFEDWVSAWSSLRQAGPVWSIDRMRFTPMVAGDALEIDAVLRVWMREGPEPSEEQAAWVQAASERSVPRVGAAVFAKPSPQGLQGPVANSQGAVDEPVTQRSTGSMPFTSNEASASAVGLLPVPAGVQSAAVALMFAPAPEHMPFAPWRLLGIWEHAGLMQAFLASGTHWFRGSAGQPISQEGHRLETVSADRVVWRDPQGQLNTLTLESKTP